MADVYHVNFHVVRKLPVFLDEERAARMATLSSQIITDHGIVVLATCVMPTHVHAVFAAFPDQTRGYIVQVLKGASARAFLEQCHEIRDELGGHLWQERYDWVLITSRRQLQAAIQYVNANRSKVGLEALTGRSWTSPDG